MSFKQLRELVALKMEWHPEVLRLLYCLDSDKVKQALTSINNKEEFNIFIRCLRDLIIPGRLSSGCKSTRAPKNPLVQFNNACNVGNNSTSQPSKGGTKGSSMTSGATKPKTISDTAELAELDGASHQLNLIKKLQKWWRCKIHSQGTEKWCFSPSSSNVCEALTISNLSFWAIQIMDGQSVLSLTEHHAPPVLG
ncbi:hypothetical protein J3R83DRAFT_12770 [Lanmaoa asiatica]|nr:hypothetical protein J3R83DRAFT_12770 [Lanmaoa asiatica]